jgi:hypothetical protein
MAQSILARLGVVMTVNSAEFKKGLDDATRESRAFQAELKRQNNESKKFAAEVGGAFTKIAGVVAIAGAAIYKAFSYADQIKDTADALDITVGSLMRMQVAFEGAGGEADKMGSLLNKLTVNQDKAKQGADNVREAFDRLGISGAEVEKLAPDKLFERVAYELSKIDEPAKRNALAFEVLGKAARGTNWKAYWEDYSKGENASKNVSEALEAGAQAWDNLKKAGTTALNAILVLAKPLADLINRFADAVARNKESGREDTYSGAFNQAKEELEKKDAYLKSSLKVRREMLEVRTKEIQAEKEMAKVTGSGTAPASGSKGGYSNASTKDQSAIRERAALSEAFKIRVEQLSTVGKQIERETKLMGLTEQEAERQKLRWAFEDENLKMQLDLQKQVELEKAKGKEADQKKIDMLKEQAQVYGVLIDMARTSAEADLRDKEAKIRTQQILTNTERQGLDQMVTNFQVLGQQSRKAFAAWKAFSIVQTIIDTYSGAQKAFTSLAGIPYVGPALGMAAAAVAIGAGMARVQMIRGQEYQGRQRGGSIVANTPYMVGEAGPELVIPHRGGTVIPNNQLSSAMGGMGGGVVYNGPYIANMSAIDTQSAMQFLAKNKEGVWAANQSASRSMPASRS